jgi:hypothetical protein
MGPEVLWPAALVALALLLVPPGSFWAGTYFGEKAMKGEVLVLERKLAEAFALTAELQKQLKEQQEAAVDAVLRARRAVEKARDRGEALADPDDDLAFERVLRTGAGDRPAASAPAASGEPTAPA